MAIGDANLEYKRNLVDRAHFIWQLRFSEKDWVCCGVFWLVPESEVRAESEANRSKIESGP